MVASILDRPKRRIHRPVWLDLTPFVCLALILLIAGSVVVRQGGPRGIQISRTPGSSHTPIAASKVLTVQVWKGPEGLPVMTWFRGYLSPQISPLKEMESIIQREQQKVDFIVVNLDIERDVTYEAAIAILDVLRKTEIPFIFHLQGPIRYAQ